MYEKTYLLSPLYSLPDKNLADSLIGDHLDKEVQQFSNRELFFLSNDKKNKLFIINSTIKHFLSFFNSPGTLESAINAFARQIQCKPDEIAQTMASFLKDMTRRGVIVDMETAERINHIEDAEDKDELLFEVGEVIEEFKIEQVISKRRLVQLFLASHCQTGQKVVIKVAKINSRVEDEHLPHIKKDFGQEFLIMKEIGEHPNVCQLISYQQEGRKPYGIIEHVEGITLRSFLQKKSPILQTKFHVIEQVFAAIAHVQSRQVIHGDIHASNFLIMADNTVKLIDFDLSNREHPQENEILRKGGVYDYIPPERTRMNAFSFMSKEADYCSEVFQLGIIMFFILYEKLPFSGFTWEQLAHKINHEHPVLATKSPSQEPIPASILKVLEQALSKAPADRYPNAMQLHQAFTKALSTNTKSPKSE